MATIDDVYNLLYDDFRLKILNTWNHVNAGVFNAPTTGEIIKGLAPLARLTAQGGAVQHSAPFPNWLGAPGGEDSLFGLLYQLKLNTEGPAGDWDTLFALVGTPNDVRTTDPPTIFSILYCLLGVDPPLFPVS